jgi:branched-subunit amino acid aminotransferase/4-amino-4-deoxychorismate lyase
LLSAFCLSSVPDIIAYLHGRLLSASQATLPLYDAGFVLGATVTEQLRTFHGELFRLPEHLARLNHSLEIAGIQPDVSITDIAEIAQRIVANNRQMIDPADDLGLCIFVTPGPYAAMAEGDQAGTNLGLHTYRLPFHLWVDAYENGVHLAPTSIVQVPANCWPPELKCRSRMHYYLADREAATKYPGSRALLLDQSGYVCETSTANVLAWFENEGLVSPPRNRVLPGISLQVVIELAGRLGIPFIEREQRIDEFARAGEAMLSSTPNGLLPVTKFAGKPIGGGRPGAVYHRLLAAWNEMLGVDIAEQARRFAVRR